MHDKFYASRVKNKRIRGWGGGGVKYKSVFKSPCRVKNPLHSARGPLGLWYFNIDSLNQTLPNILKIVMRANEPKKLYINLSQPQLDRVTFRLQQR